MRRPLAIATGLLALLLAGPTFAFEQTPEAPPPAATPSVTAPALQLGTPTPVGTQAQEPSGAKVFGFSILPKLDFGLEVMYGDEQQQDLQLQQQGTLPDDGDVTVLGKFKKHF